MKLAEQDDPAIIVGTKQTLKAINNNQVIKVFVANDIDQQIKKELLDAVKKHEILLEMVDSKLKLGGECGIDVSAASAALLKKLEGGGTAYADN